MDGGIGDGGMGWEGGSGHAHELVAWLVEQVSVRGGLVSGGRRGDVKGWRG